MVKLGKGQAILGGGSQSGYQNKIYSMNCYNRNCLITLLSSELSVPKGLFVAIPIPDTIAGCISGGNSDNKQEKLLHNQLTKRLFHLEI
jgi:hypothetical protein